MTNNNLKTFTPYLFKELVYFVKNQDDLDEYIDTVNHNLENKHVNWWAKIFQNEIADVEDQLENLKEDRNFVFNLTYQDATNSFNDSVECIKKQYMEKKNLKSWNKIKKFDYELWVELIDHDMYSFCPSFDLLYYILEGSAYSDQIQEEKDFIENKNNHEFILEWIKQYHKDNK